MESGVFSLAEGETLADRYRIESVLGEGGMGKVFLAYDQLMNQRVALKVLHPELCRDERHKQRFLREVQLNRVLNHPNVVKIYEAGTFGDGLYLTMEYVEGTTLKARLAEAKMDISETIRILKEICKGLSIVHSAKIIHRDLKPGNVLLGKDGEVKIADFGVARPGMSDLTQHDEVIGCAPYIAPEVWMGKAVSTQADIYALGIIAYEMIAAELPFDGDAPADLMRKHLESRPYPLAEINQNSPDWLNNLVLQLLEKDPQRRPESGASVVDILTRGPVMNSGVGRSSDEPQTTAIEADFLNYLQRSEATILDGVAKADCTQSESQNNFSCSSNHLSNVTFELEESKEDLSTKTGKASAPRRDNFVSKIGSYKEGPTLGSTALWREVKRGKSFFPNALLILASISLALCYAEPIGAWLLGKFGQNLAQLPDSISIFAEAAATVVIAALFAGIPFAALAVFCQGLRARFLAFLLLCGKGWGSALVVGASVWGWYGLQIYLNHPAGVAFAKSSIEQISKASVTNLIEGVLLIPNGTRFSAHQLNFGVALDPASDLSFLAAAPQLGALIFVAFLMLRTLNSFAPQHEPELWLKTARTVSLALALAIGFEIWALPALLGWAQIAGQREFTLLIGNTKLALPMIALISAALNYLTILVSFRCSTGRR